MKVLRVRARHGRNYTRPFYVFSYGESLMSYEPEREPNIMPVIAGTTNLDDLPKLLFGKLWDASFCEGEELEAVSLEIMKALL